MKIFWRVVAPFLTGFVSGVAIWWTAGPHPFLAGFGVAVIAFGANWLIVSWQNRIAKQTGVQGERTVAW